MILINQLRHWMWGTHRVNKNFILKIQISEADPIIRLAQKHKTI